jgi:hypothetical protein
MAMLNNPEEKWVHVEASRDHHTFDIKMRIAVRSSDGWIQVLDIANDGWVSDSPPSRRQILENIHHNITIQLAELTLEET